MIEIVEEVVVAEVMGREGVGFVGDGSGFRVVSFGPGEGFEGVGGEREVVLAGREGVVKPLDAIRAGFEDEAMGEELPLEGGRSGGAIEGEEIFVGGLP